MATKEVMMIHGAICELKNARDNLRAAGANKAADYVARALKSTEGALRHARHMATRKAMESEETEDATFCAFCDATHWPSDETESDSTWQQWLCHDCQNWNDKVA